MAGAPPRPSFPRSLSLVHSPRRFPRLVLQVTSGMPTRLQRDHWAPIEVLGGIVTFNWEPTSDQAEWGWEAHIVPTPCQVRFLCGDGLGRYCGEAPMDCLCLLTLCFLLSTSLAPQLAARDPRWSPSRPAFICVVPHGEGRVCQGVRVEGDFGKEAKFETSRWPYRAARRRRCGPNTPLHNHARCFTRCTAPICPARPVPIRLPLRRRAEDSHAHARPRRHALASAHLRDRTPIRLGAPSVHSKRRGRREGSARWRSSRPRECVSLNWVQVSPLIPCMRIAFSYPPPLGPRRHPLRPCARLG